MKKTICPLVLAFLLASSGLSPAATIAFSNSFNSAGFTNTSGLTLNTGAGTVTTTATGATTPVSYGSEQFTNAANTSFSISTQFVATSLGTNNGDQSVSIGLFGLDSAFTGTTNATRYIQAGWVFQGTTLGALRLLEVDGTNVTLATQTIDTNGAGAGVYTVNTTLTLRIDITNTALNTYNLSLGLFDAAGTTQFGSFATVTGYVASAEPSGGYYLGIRNRIPNLSGTTTLVNNDFNVIPEPSTYALMGLGLGALYLLRRRTKPSNS